MAHLRFCSLNRTFAVSSDDNRERNPKKQIKIWQRK